MNFVIGNTPVGEEHPCFIVAELSCNHLGSLDRALLMIETAAMCGANAVKIQTDNPDGGITIDCDNKYFTIQDGPWKGRTLYDLYRETYTPWEWTGSLQEKARECGVELFTTVSCLTGLLCMEEMYDMPAYKISSFEVTDVPLIREVWKTGKPIIFSDGCSDGYDIAWAYYHSKWATLNCVSQYPADPAEYQLFQHPHGISDHTTTNTAAIVAVARGAKIVEKHFTMNRELGGPDSGFSAEPGEFREMVNQIRIVETMGTRPRKIDRTFCKSLFVVQDIKAGERYTKENIGVIRPGHGMHPKHYDRVIGLTAKQDVSRGTPLKESML